MNLAKIVKGLRAVSRKVVKRPFAVSGRPSASSEAPSLSTLLKEMSLSELQDFNVWMTVLTWRLNDEFDVSDKVIDPRTEFSRSSVEDLTLKELLFDTAVEAMVAAANKNLFSTKMAAA